jgi:hypothetical protein
MKKQSLNNTAPKAIFAWVAAALLANVFIFSPSRRRPFIPRV